VQSLALETKEITQQTPVVAPPIITVKIPPPQITVDIRKLGKRGRRRTEDGAVVVFFSRRKSHVSGPFFKLRYGRTVPRSEAEKLVSREALQGKVERAKGTLLRKHPDIIFKLSSISEE
jgi:hypothetical protein